MAVLCRAQVTLAVTVDVSSVTTWYRLQASSSAAPSKPTALTPSGWTQTEPSYTGGSTSTLYTCQRTVLSDNTFSWSQVSVSSSYEAAKAAWNKAQAAADAATATANHFFYDSAGAHVSTVEGSTATGDAATLASGALSFTHDGVEQARFGTSEVRLLGGDAMLRAVEVAGGRVSVSLQAIDALVLRGGGYGLAASRTGVDLNVVPTVDGTPLLLAPVRLATAAGTGVMSYDLTGYSAVMVTCSFAGYLGSAVLPVASLASSGQEVYLTGGGAGGDGRRVACSVALASAQGVVATKDGADVTSQATWSIYGM